MTMLTKERLLSPFITIRYEGGECERDAAEIASDKTSCSHQGISRHDMQLTC